MNKAYAEKWLRLLRDEETGRGKGGGTPHPYAGQDTTPEA